MMRKIEGFTVLAVIAAGLLVLASCDTMEAEPEDVLEPHAVGNRWVYLVSPFDLPLQDTLTMEIDREVRLRLNGRLVPSYAFRFHFNGQAFQPELERLWSSRVEGLYQIGAFAPSDTLLFEALAFPYPAQVGDTGTLIRYHLDYHREPPAWQITDTLVVQVISTNERVRTPAGVFLGCYVYKYHLPPPPDVGLGDDVYAHYAPGVGLVAQITRSPENFDHVKQHRLLYEYTIK